MNYDPQQIVNFFIRKGIEEKVPITPIQGNKLTYIAHGWHLALLSKPLFEERAEAWKYGPAIESIYQSLKKHRNNPITAPIEYCVPPDDCDGIKFLEAIWDGYKNYFGLQLSALTHQKGTPWWVTIEPYMLIGVLPKGLTIDNELIEKYYKTSLKN